MSDLQEFCYSKSTRILAFDLAKIETGFASLEISAQDSPEFKWVNWGRYKTDARNDKYMFLVGNELAAQIYDEIWQARHNHNVHVIIEHPAFDSSRSEQQYFLFQCALSVLSELQVNTTTISIGLLKSFIKGQVSTDLPTFLKKSATLDNLARTAAGKKSKTLS